MAQAIKQLSKREDVGEGEVSVNETGTQEKATWQEAARRPASSYRFTVEEFVAGMVGKGFEMIKVSDGRGFHPGGMVKFLIGRDHTATELVITTVPRVELIGPVEVEACPVPDYLVWGMTLDQSDTWRVRGRLNRESSVLKLVGMLAHRRRLRAIFERELRHEREEIERLEAEEAAQAESCDRQPNTEGRTDYETAGEESQPSRRRGRRRGRRRRRGRNHHEGRAEA